MGELALVRALSAALEQAASGGRLEVGIGDDAAVVRVAGDRCVVSTDAMVQDVHFALDWASPEDVGRRAAAGALSDLAAMGAAAGEVYLAVTVPAGFAPEGVVALVTGAHACAQDAGALVAGGDLVAGPGLAVCATVVGWLRPGDRALTRAGARPGDRVAVTGPLGGAALALRDPAADRAPLLRPVPRIAAGRALAAAGATAAIDLSDGLASDAMRIAERSGVRLELRLADLPCAPGADPELAATGGEDYELCVCVPDGFRPPDDVALTIVGRVVAGDPAAVFTDASGPLRGFEHFG